jgi:DNA adenine methylase Dam
VTSTPPSAAGQPILKWVGGKGRLLPHLVPLYDERPRVVEPFFGGGALSFHLAATRPGLRVVGNDLLAPVVEIYEAVRTDVEAFITEVDTFATPYLAAGGKAERRAFYYDVRERYLRRELDGPAVLFFMLWCAYSGLYRTGRTYPGRFNTPHGFGLEKPGFYHPERLRATAPLMAGWELTSTDFAATLERVDADTFVFCDPPYRQTYDGYTGDGFSEQDQLRVVEYVHRAAERGARVVYTNKDTGDGFYERHFAGFTIDRVPIRYQVNRNCVDVGRPVTHEVIVHNG